MLIQEGNMAEQNKTGEARERDGKRVSLADIERLGPMEIERRSFEIITREAGNRIPDDEEKETAEAEERKRIGRTKLCALAKELSGGGLKRCETGPGSSRTQTWRAPGSIRPV